MSNSTLVDIVLPLDATHPPTVSVAARPAVRLRGIAKTFVQRGSRRRVFDDLELRLDLDRVNLLFGPNGSGKSTLLRLLAGLVTPDAGHVDYTGPWPPGARPVLLHAGSGPGVLVARLTVRENVRWFAAMGDYELDEPRLDTLLRRLDLSARADDLVEGLSRGQQQKALLVRALACRTDLVLLDEPTEYLDDDSVAILADLLASAARDGTGFVIATHDRRLRAIPSSLSWRAACGVFLPDAEHDHA